MDNVARRATYRLQLHAGFPFDAARAQLDYLREVGISHLYCSPITQAAHGSTHGYDVVDPTRISDELGGEAAFRTLAADARQRGMGILIDIVPNHMCTDDPGSVWWRDVLEDGRWSPYADFFDIDWERDHPLLHGKVLVPILGDQVGRVLDAGDLTLVWEDGISLRYLERLLPLAPESVARILAEVDHDSARSLAERIGQLWRPDYDDISGCEARHTSRIDIGRRIRSALNPHAVKAVRAHLETINSDATALDTLLLEQHYRLAHWQTAAEEINYRRFFDVASLVALRMENPRVFAASHELCARLYRDGVIAGVRVDHVDGLRNPGEYLQRLRELLGGTAWILVEKILAVGEKLPDDWPVDGTTGYEFAAATTALLTDAGGEAPLAAHFRDVTGDTADAEQSLREGRVTAMESVLMADIDHLHRLLADICSADPHHRDHTPSTIADSLREVLSEMRLYRTYVNHTGASQRDSDAIAATVERVKVRRDDLDPALLDLIAATALGGVDGQSADDFRARFPQVSSAVAAKGVEDTAFYRYIRLASQNEVGSEFDQFSLSVSAFHDFNRAALRFPHALLATTTHDTKRSEDVRARLAVLSEIPGEWKAATERWHDMVARHRADGLIDGRTEYLFFQTMVGAFPWDLDRAIAYMHKATMEAKDRTSWLAPNADFDAAVEAFVRGCFGDSAWREDVGRFMPAVIEAGRINAIAQTVLKLTSPGVPDIYQGTEVWSDSLVDPDNRRAVDYEALHRSLAHGAPPAVTTDLDGTSKSWTIRQVLTARTAHPTVFDGAYGPLEADGPEAEHVVAFSRGDNRELIVVVPRLNASRLSGWARETTVTLPRGRRHNLLGGGDPVLGGECAVADLLRDFPCAVLLDV